MARPMIAIVALIWFTWCMYLAMYATLPPDLNPTTLTIVALIGPILAILYIVAMKP